MQSRLLERCTHNPKKRDHAIDGYARFQWEAECIEVAKLQVSRQRRGEVIEMPLAARAAGAEGPEIGRSATTAKAAQVPEIAAVPRRLGARN